MMVENKRPLGVSIIAYLNIVGGILTLVAGLMTLILFIGILLIPLGILGIAIGYGLLKGKEWARVITIILSVLGVIESIFYLIKLTPKSIIVGLIELVISGLIIYYLTKNENAKKFFEEKNK